MNESFKENLKPFIFVLIVLILTAITAHSQRKFGGTVTEVIDGKTCVIKLPGGQLTVILQYVEIPEPEQPLRQTVKEHLEKLVLGKAVDFLPRGVAKDKTIGQLLVKGVDISQQMLRDGAAWYSVPEQSGQDEAQSLLYKDNETQARSEKRGLWSVENLKPSWEFRAEQAALEQKRREEAMRPSSLVGVMQSERRSPSQKSQGSSNAQVEMWADVGGAYGYEQPLGVGGLLAGYNPTVRIGHISTPSIFLDFPKADLLQKVESRLYYLYRGDKSSVEDSAYAVAFVTTASDYRFVKSNNLTISADGEKIYLGKAFRFYRANYANKQELLVYKIKRAQIAKIVKAQKIGLQLGSYTGGISAESLAFINNLLTAS